MVKGSKKRITVGAALAFMLALAGCGSDTAANGGNAAQGAPEAQQQQPSDNGGDPGAMNGRQAFDLLGKVKSVDGTTLSVYKSSFVPGQGGPRGGNGGQRGQGDGNPPQGDGAGRQNGGDQPQADNGGNAGNGGNGRGRINMDNMFTDETVDVQITAETKIVKTEFADGNRTTTELTAADLKADDVVSIDLKDDTQEAVTITLGGMGGFGGGMGGGRGFGNGGGGPRASGQSAEQGDAQAR